MREKITHFDHERIPERIVHARSAAAHGASSRCTNRKPNSPRLRSCRIRRRKRRSTYAFPPCKVRAARPIRCADVRGFAVFYTDEGNFDMVGKLMLNRNPDNFFAETEQVAFCPGHIVPGLDFRTIRCCRGVCSSTLTHRSAVWAGRTSTKFRSIVRSRRCTTVSATRCIARPSTRDRHRMSRIPLMADGRRKPRRRPAASKAIPNAWKARRSACAVRRSRITFASDAVLEQHDRAGEGSHGYSFELSKVERKNIRERQLGILGNIDETLAARVAENLSLPAPKKNASADELGKSSVKDSSALSIVAKTEPSVKTRNRHSRRRSPSPPQASSQM